MADEKEVRLYSPDSDDDVMHYGTPRHSGRYPWGSGKNPQRSRDFMSRNEELKKKGVSEAERAKSLIGPDATTEDLRNRISITNEARKLAAVYAVRRLAEKGMSDMEISRQTGVPPTTVREYKKEDAVIKASRYTSVANLLEDEVKEKGYIDVGRGAANLLGVSEKQVTVACQILKDRGYTVTNVQVPQLTTDGKTSVLTLAKKGSTYRDIVDNHLGDIQMVTDKYITTSLHNGDPTVVTLKPPVSIDRNRVYVRYAEDGGKERDGTIEVRRGVPDLSLGDSHYAQVRIAVDDKYYMKGMCTESDDIPAGYDVVYNTNKKRGTLDYDVFKHMTDPNADTGPINRFGALIKRQNQYTDDKGNTHQGVLNIVREEGEWADWSDSLPSQFLSKQSVPLAKQQLDLDYKNRKVQFDEIKSLTNPVVKEALLEKFSDGCDGAAVNLKAASLPRQGYHVLLPLPDIKDNEIYAPNYHDGDKVVLVRFPHGGIFEMPQLTVNNKRSKIAKNSIPNATDAVGISAKVAEQLSGADFDGDTAIVIPNRGGRIQTMAPLESLKDFEPKSYKYPKDPSSPYVGAKKGEKVTVDRGDGTTYNTVGDGFRKEMEMGKITNLISDMTMAGADYDKIARATKYSMVVIDAIKHQLNWKQAKQDYAITELYKEYTGRAGGGATTVVSRASGETTVPKRGASYIDPETGKKMYRPAKGSQWINKEGELVTKTQKTSKMDAVDDAYELLSDNPTKMELTYADHANRCKALGNEARKEILRVRASMPKKDPAAAEKYAAEVESLKIKLNESKKAAAYEKQVQILGNEKYNAWLADNPHADKQEQKKQRGKCQTWARNDLGLKKYRIDFTDREWEAVQNNAISPTMFRELLANADMDKVTQRAMPKVQKGLSANSKSRIKAMARSGYTQDEIADSLGLSTSTINDVLNS